MHNFYKSKEWLDLLNYLKLSRVNKEGNIICEYCNKVIFKDYDCIGHHIIELNESNVNDYNISLNSNNIMLVHHKCHNIIHERFEGKKQKKIYIVYGSPCSGKSTWVKNVANKNDLIVDVDSIWECLSINDKYHKSNCIKSNVLDIRDKLIEQIKMRLGMWHNAYIIGGYPLNMDRQRLADNLGAECIFIECDKETCLNRCINEEWKKYVEEWFCLYQE